MSISLLAIKSFFFKSPKLWLLAGFLAYSVGVFYAGKYTAYKEQAATVSQKVVKDMEKRSAIDVKKADQSARDFANLQNENRELRRQLSEAIVSRDTSCDLTDDELRLLNESILKSSRR